MSPHRPLKAAHAFAFCVPAVIRTGRGALSIVTLAGIRHRVADVGTNRSPPVAAVNETRSAASGETAADVPAQTRRDEIGVTTAAGAGAGTGTIAGLAGAAEETAAASQVLGAASGPSRQSEHPEAEIDRFLATAKAA